MSIVDDAADLDAARDRLLKAAHDAGSRACLSMLDEALIQCSALTASLDGSTWAAYAAVEAVLYASPRLGRGGPLAAMPTGTEDAEYRSRQQDEGSVRSRNGRPE